MDIYVAIDGDNIGRLIGQSALNDDPESIKLISNAINSALEDIKHLAEIYGGEIISLGGDESIIKFNSEELSKKGMPASSLDEIEQEIHDLIERFAKHIFDEYKFTVTAGVGSTLSEASKSLLVGKLNGKNQVVIYSPDVDKFIEGVRSGEIELDTKDNQIELNKLKEEYLKALKNKNNSQENTSDLESKEELPEEYKEHVIIDEHPIMERKDEHFKNFLETKGDLTDNEKLDLDQKGEDLDSDKVNNQDKDNELQHSGKEPDMDIQDTGDENDEKLKFLDTDSGNSAQTIDEKAGGEENLITPEQEQALELRNQTDRAKEDMPQDDTVNIQELDLSEEEQLLLEQIKEQLRVFKENKHELEELRENNPELYEAILNMLQNLIESVKTIKKIDIEQEEPVELGSERPTNSAEESPINIPPDVPKSMGR